VIAQLETRYKAVVCARCGAPISVSAKITRLQEDPRDDTAATPRTFMARCRSCENEGVYTIDSIRSFEGEPTRRKSRSQSV
jgi:RNase P subunit RPR2